MARAIIEARRKIHRSRQRRVASGELTGITRPNWGGGRKGLLLHIGIRDAPGGGIVETYFVELHPDDVEKVILSTKEVPNEHK